MKAEDTLSRMQYGYRSSARRRRHNVDCCAAYLGGGSGRDTGQKEIEFGDSTLFVSNGIAEVDPHRE